MTTQPLRAAIVLLGALTAIGVTNGPAHAQCPAPACAAGADFFATNDVCIVDPGPGVPCNPPCGSCVPWTAFQQGGLFCSIITTGAVELATTAASPNVNMSDLRCVSTAASGFNISVSQGGGGGNNPTGLVSFLAQRLALVVGGGIQIKTELMEAGTTNALTTVDMRSLTTIDGGLDIVLNPVLTSIDFSSLQTTGVALNGGSVTIEDNDLLPNLGPAWPLTLITDDLRIIGNRQLTTLGALSSLTTVGGDIWITGGSMLATTIGLWGVTSVGSQIYIFGTPLITVQFPHLYTAGKVWIRDNASLVQILFPALGTVASKFIVEMAHPVLTTIDLQSLMTIGALPDGDQQGYFYSNSVTTQFLTIFRAPTTFPNCPTYWSWIDANTNSVLCASNFILSLYNAQGGLGCLVQGQVVP